MPFRPIEYVRSAIKVWGEGLSARTWLFLCLSAVAIALGAPNRWLHWFPAALVSLVPLFYVCWSATWKQQARYVATVWLLAGTLVFLPDPFSVAALSAFELVGGVVVSPLVPLYFVTVTLLSLQLSRVCPSWLRPAAIALVWSAFDSSFGLVQFPLPLHYGACLYDFTWAIQIADITSIWGVTFLAIISNATLAAILRQLPSARRWSAAWLGIALWAVALVYGANQLPAYTALSEGAIATPSTSLSESTSAPTYHIGTLQQVAWLEADRSWAYREQRYRQMQAASRAAIAEGADLIAWPEGAMRAQVAGTELETFVLSELVTDLPAGGRLLTGSSEPLETNTDEPIPWDEVKYINSALLYRPDGVISDRYGKQWLFQYFETARFVPSPDGYRPLDAGPVMGSLGVSICLESVMPRPARLLVRSGAESLVTISDDSWFGQSNWPILHSVLSVFRAVETRRSFAFVNNTGGNLVVLPSGAIANRGDFWQRGHVTGPMVRQQTLTIATRYGDWFAWVALGGTAILAVGVIMPGDRHS